MQENSLKEKDTKTVSRKYQEEDMKQREGREKYKVPVSMMRPIFVLSVLGMLYNLQAQPIKKPQFNKWIFPNFCQIDFTTGDPVFSKNGSAYSAETTGSLCDKNGNILFYSDGSAIYDSSHAQMPNGDIWKSMSARMGPLFIPVIADSTKYYVFQVDGGSSTFTGNCGPLGRWDGLYYHIIDMTMNGGLGDVVPGRKNISLVDSTGEAVIAIMHENEKDFWVIVRKAHTNAYYSYLVTENGVCTTPLISTFSGGLSSNPKGLITLAPSHDETQIAVAQGTSSAPGLAQIFDFDKCTGRLSNPKNISNIARSYYDVAFSPNDSLIYLTHYGPSYPAFFQYQRYASDIPLSEIVIGGSIPWGLYPNMIGYFGMRVYGDTMYIGNADSSLHILSNPDNYGNPGLQNHWIHTASFGARVSYNFPNYFNYQSGDFDKLYVATKDTFICAGDSIYLGSDRNCSDSSYSYSWSPSTGLDNDTIPNPIARPTTTTRYVVTVNFLCNTFTDTITINIPIVDAGEDTTICIGDSAILTASSNSTFLWSTGDTTASISAIPSATTSYFITTTDSLCPVTDSVQVTINQLPLPVTITGPSQLCMDASIMLSVLGPTPYMWSTGDTLSSITISPTANTSYWVQSANNCGISSDTVNIAVNAPPVLQVTDHISISNGATAALIITGANTYLWSNGSTLNSIYVSPEQTTTYTVTGYDSLGCYADASVTVTITSLAFAYLPNVFYTASNNPENEKLFVFGKNIKSYELSIYDRWGEKVYETFDAFTSLRGDGLCCAYGEGWDGTLNNSGKPLNEAVFVFILNGEFTDGRKFNESGNISLIK